ncbi:hypothetical protein BD770DRAFT_438746 [Pilaira anomala]|nr:hypothetical protein BD770DRAFT_438746 [Pilaira anomala]
MTSEDLLEALVETEKSKQVLEAIAKKRAFDEAVKSQSPTELKKSKESRSKHLERVFRIIITVCLLKRTKTNTYSYASRIKEKYFRQVPCYPDRNITNKLKKDISLCQRRVDEDTFGWCTCLIPSPSSIVNTTDNNANNDTNNENIPATSSTVNTTDTSGYGSNANNDTNNENIPAASSNVNTTEKHNTSLKRLIQELKDEIKEDEERLERKRKKLKLLQDAYEF